MSDRLRMELTAYQLCMLDDSFVESPHAQISRVTRQTSVPSPSWWSATVRLNQNFLEYDRSVVDSPGRFEHFFDCWKLLSQFRPSAYLSGRGVQVPWRSFLRSVYRTGAQETQRDWSALRRLTDRPLEVVSDVKPSDMEALIKEYLLAIFVPGSVVEVQDTRGVSVDELVSGQGGLQHVGQGALVAERRFYQVVSRTLLAKKFVSTEKLASIRRMRVPLVLQRLALHGRDHQESPTSVLAVPEGFPEALDCKSLASWRDLRYGLHSWAVQGVTDHGGLVLEGRRPLGQLAWCSDSVIHSWKRQERTFCLPSVLQTSFYYVWTSCGAGVEARRLCARNPRAHWP